MSDKKLTILMLVTRRQYRGAEISACNLSKALIEKGHKVIWIGLYSNSGHDIVSIEGAENIDLPDGSGWLSLKKIRKLISIIKEYKPIICQANGSDTLRYLVALKLLGCKLNLVYRNISIISKWVNTKPKYYLFRFLFSKVDKVISVGEEALQDFNQFFQFPASKAQVIRRGIPIIQPNLSEVELIKKQYSISNDDYVFIHIGHFSAEKNHEFLIKVWQKLTQKHNTIKLVLLGDGSLREGVLEKVKQNNLSNSVIAPGLQTNIADWLSLSKTMLLCSTIEGVPGVVVEASFQGVPTVAVNVGGVKEVLIDGENGLLVPSHDENRFIEQCEKLLLNKEYQLQLGTTAKTIVRERFDLNENTNQFIAMYESII
jgi:glycosyltransferase involved in cell wall biosynthesis